MRNPAIVSAGILAVLFGVTSVALSQHAPPPPGWPLCPRCQGPQDRAQAREKEKVDGHAFDPHNLDGVWGNNGIELDVKNVPPFTAWGYEQYQATRAEDSPLGIPLSNSKDPMMRCDPLGYPRLFAYNYGFEFLQEKDRVVQFFEWGHNWRTIWTDGRKLPKNPDPAWYGYSVGHWEADTFVVESTGYDDRTWLDHFGNPVSEEARLEERYRRVDRDTLELTMVLTDPKAYTKPWVSEKKTFKLDAKHEIQELFCVPSENDAFNKRVRDPGAGVSSK